MKLSPQLASASLTLALTVWLTGCASTGIPLPPSLELPKPVTDLRALRKGSRVYLAWTIPTETTDRQSIRHPGPTRICRSLQPTMSTCGIPAGELAAPASPVPTHAAGPAKGQAFYSDTLPPEFLQRSPADFITFGVEVLNANRRSAGLSNLVQVSAAPTLPPPENFRAQLTAEGVILTWKGVPPPQSVTGLHFVYRVYRGTEGNNSATIVGDVPLNPDAQAELRDHSFDWEKTYKYRAMVVTMVPQPNQPDLPVEGDDTPSVQVTTHDIFPPAVPSGLQAVYSGVGQQPFIDLIWSPVTEADLAGYNVYRHEEGQQAVKINSAPVATPAYRDNNVQSTRKYFYTVTSVDLRGNESAASEETSEQVP